MTAFKLRFLLLTTVFFVFINIVAAQESVTRQNVLKLPKVQVAYLKGNKVTTDTFSNDGKPFIISFWATWCKPCLKELSTIAEVYEDWQEETGVKLFAVSIDDSRSSSQVKTLVSGKSWEYEIYLDPNSDLKRALNVNIIPHTFIVSGNGEIVWQHTGYSEGSELEILSVVRKLLAGEPVSDQEKKPGI